VSGTALLNATLTLDRAAASLQLGVSAARVELDTLRAGSVDEAARRGQAAVQTVTGSLGAAFWGETLAALLDARYHEGALELAPVLSVPGSSVRAVGTLTGLEMEEGQITLYLLAPTNARYAAHKPDKQPKVGLHQAELPSQPAAGVPVQASVEAQTTIESYRPYDYAWTGSGSPQLLPVRGPRLEVTGKPTGRMGDPETVGKAHVALIDAFGQVATADAPVLAHPAPRQRRTMRRVLQASVVAAVIAALTLAGVAIAGPGLGGFLGGGGATATATQAAVANFAVSPLTTMQVGCDSAAGTAVVSPIALDNSAGGTNIPWQASITDQAPGGGEPWATFADGSQAVSGTVSAGQTQQLQVQPARDLCRRVFDTRAQQTFHVALTYTTSTTQQATVTVAVGVSQVAVSVQTKVAQSKTGQTTLRQDCNNSANPVQAFSILLDGSPGTAPTTYQVQISDPPPAASGLPTPTPGGSTVWATADNSSGTVPAGQQVTVTITPAPGLCNGVSQSQPSDLHVVVALGTGARSVTVTDTLDYVIF
jgi:hypothetical protein